MRFSNWTLLLIFCLPLLTACNSDTDAFARLDAATIIDTVETASRDKDAYRLALKENTLAAYQAYLSEFPDGQFHPQVRKHLKNLTNRAAQAEYAYDYVMTTLRQIPAARHVRTAPFPAYRPTAGETLRSLDRRLSTQLEKFRRDAPNKLPDNYLKYLDKELQQSGIYGKEITTQLKQYEKQQVNKIQRENRGAIVGKIRAQALRTILEKHIKKCRASNILYIKRFRERGEEARTGLASFRMGRPSLPSLQNPAPAAAQE